MPNPRPSLPPNPPPPAPSLLPDVTTHISTIKSNLRAHSRYIRDTLQPHLSTPGATLTPTELSTLKSIFASVSAIPITLELLQYSRIEKAVAVVASGGGAWPADASLMAETLLNRWEEKVGPMKNVKADLWGQGGRLEGVQESRCGLGGRRHGIGAGGNHSLKRGRDQADLVCRGGARRGKLSFLEQPGRRMRMGILGSRLDREFSFQLTSFETQKGQRLKCCSWWLKPAAAFRDGIIDSRHYSITADEFGAYAILLEGDSERPGVTEAMVKEPSDSTEFAALKTSGVNKWRHKNYDVERPSIRFLPTPGDPGIHKLTREISRRNGIRVMRMAKLKSPLAPRVGVRYDGLYVSFLTSFYNHFKFRAG